MLQLRPSGNQQLRHYTPGITTARCSKWATESYATRTGEACRTCEVPPELRSVCTAPRLISAAEWGLR